jgi:hypothetical protein
VSDREPQATAAYTVTVADLQADRQRIVALWQINPLQPDLADAKYQWLYLDNPSGPARHLLLHHGSQPEPVGAAGMVTRQFVARGAPLAAGLLTDLYVRAEHRSLFPALMLQKQMRSVGLGVHGLLYGYPNDKSLLVVRRLGYRRLGDFARFVCLLRYGEYLEHWLPRGPSRFVGAIVDRCLPLVFRPHRLLREGWRGEWLDGVDVRFDALWEAARRADGIIGVRDRRYLSWRFLARPSHRYRIFALSKSNADAIAGYAVCEVIGDTMHIRDMLVAPQVGGAHRVLLHLLARQARLQACTRLSFDVLGDDTLHRRLRAAGLFERGTTPLVALWHPDLDATMEKLDWYLTAADTEL